MNFKRRKPKNQSPAWRKWWKTNGLGNDLPEVTKIRDHRRGDQAKRDIDQYLLERQRGVVE